MTTPRTHRPSARLLAVVTLFLLAATGGSAVALADDGPRSGDVTPTVLGNPAIGSATAPDPVGTLGFTLPPTLPKGATPDDHVYVTATAGTTEFFGAAEFSLPPGLSIDSLTLTVKDDGAPGEDVAAETAPLYACYLPSTVYATTPNDTVNYDCTLPSKGVRKATAEGGTWTFNVSPLATNVDKKGQLGLALVGDPAGMAAYSVSVIRKSVSLHFEGSVPDDSVPVIDVPLLTPPGVTSQPAQVQPETGTIASTPELPAIGQADPGASIAGRPPAVSGAAPQVVQQGSTPGIETVARTTSARRWRPLLLLLVPLVPFVVFALGRRWDEDQDENSLAAQFPGLAGLRS